MTGRAPRRLAGLARPLALGLGLLVAAVGPAAAHRLKLFVTVENGDLGGYAFFVGGGRPEGVDVVVEDATGAAVFRGKTDDRGAFRWHPAAAADYTVVVDTGDGHWAKEKIAADRFGAALAAAPAPTPLSTPAAAPASTPAPSGAPACAAPTDPAALSREIERAVDAAVARRTRPLMEAYDLAEGRIRFNDVMGGIGMIVGLAGAGAWAFARRRDAGAKEPRS